MILSKLHFVLSVAEQVTPFLEAYQCVMPVLPFFAMDMFALMELLMSRIVKKNIMTEQVNTQVKMMDFDFSDDSFLLEYAKVDIGFAASSELSELHSKMGHWYTCIHLLDMLSASALRRWLTMTGSSTTRRSYLVFCHHIGGFHWTSVMTFSWNFLHSMRRLWRRTCLFKAFDQHGTRLGSFLYPFMYEY